MTLATVSAVIPNWNGERWLEGCIRSVHAQVGVDADLLVVDNGSSDGSRQLLDELDVRYTSLSSNEGFARAVNRGIRDTSSRHILLLNADASIEPTCMRELVSWLDRNPTLGGVQPTIKQGPTGETLYSTGQILLRDGRAYERDAGKEAQLAPRAVNEIFGVCGAVALLRREMLDRIGGFDETYFAFYEDVELNARARSAGWRFMHVPSAVALHQGHAAWLASANDPEAFNAYLVARNRLTTSMRYVQAKDGLRLTLAEVGSVARSFRAGTLSATVRGKRDALRGICDAVQVRRSLKVGRDDCGLGPWRVS